MSKVKRYRPSKATTPKPKQPKLDGFSNPMLDEIEGAAEAYKVVEDEVKEKRKELTKELDAEQTKLIAVLRKHGQDSIIINGLSIRIIEKEKAEVKGVPKLKSEREKDDTQIEISVPGRRSVTLTPDQMRQAADTIGAQA